MAPDSSVHALAAEAFKNHVLSENGPGRWLCKRPGTILYGFEIILSPGYVVLLGDLGDLVLRHSERDSLHWLLGCSDHHYLLGKATRRDGMRTFEGHRAFGHLKYLESEGHAELAAKIRDDWDPARNLNNADAWRSAYYSRTGDFEVPACDRWSDQALWQAEALLWFREAYEAAQVPIHAVPPRGAAQCPCGIWPLEHLDHRITSDMSLVTCPGCLEALRNAAP